MRLFSVRTHPFLPAGPFLPAHPFLSRDRQGAVLTLPLVTVAAFILVGISGCGASASKGADAPQGGPPAVPVAVGEVKRQPVPLEVKAIGNVEALSTVGVKSQVGGQLMRVFFEEGQEVRQGQPLFLIDPRQYEQAVREAEAALAAQKAALGQSEANYARSVAESKNAKAQAERYAGLSAKGVVSREQNDQFQTSAEAAAKGAIALQATIESVRAGVQGAEARLADAKLQLSYTRIAAPVSGKTGNLMLKAGNLVQANAAEPLVTINQVSPVYATFSVPESSLSDIRKYRSEGKLSVQAFSAQDTADPAEGTLDFIDNSVDQATGTIRLKARFPNKDRRLWPGQFVNAVLLLDTPEETVAPTAAVQTSQKGSYVFVLKPDMTAEQRVVQVSRTWKDLSVIAKGVKPGERIVVEGQLRLRPGAKAKIVPRGKVTELSAPAGAQ